MFRNFIDGLRNWWTAHQPAFWSRLSPAYRSALVILVVVVLWIASGVFSGSSSTGGDADAKANETPRVQVALLQEVSRNATITVRGRTQALHAVDVKAEVEGSVQALHFERGDHVKKGQTLCEIKTNDRAAKLDQARAMVAQTEKQHDVDLDLAKNGFRSKIQVATSAAQLEAARASERSMQIQLANTRMIAPFDGIADDRYVDVGDYMRVGDKCALVIAPEPFLAIGTVSEQQVGQIKAGDPATAVLVTGETVQGHVRFVAAKADDTTRTFRIEVELPNPDAKLRDGVSADIHIPVRQVMAAKISPGILVLDDNGIVGVRTVVAGVVRFKPVQIISDGPDGMWISGLPNGTTVITVGQEFVNDGEHVKAVSAGAKA
ncbi:MAG TPA: efflux RND transporter periplasmic adaptor subunit [Rhizomicrobium sp.]|mgnify:FL=1|nr:efflux RND transporter periplasmic adaptor subunit [Rhizomicrobium sp.]